MGLSTILWNMLDDNSSSHRRQQEQPQPQQQQQQQQTLAPGDHDLRSNLPTTPHFSSTHILNMEPKTEVRMIEYSRRCRRGKDPDAGASSGAAKPGEGGGAASPGSPEHPGEEPPAKRGFFHLFDCEECCVDPETGAKNLIMSPPPYSDLGKNARDVFGNGYHFGLIKLNCKTKTASGVEFSTGGTSNQENGKVFGSLETKYKVKDYGVTFTEKWNTDNTLATEIAVQDQLMKGLKLSADCTFAPQTGSKTGHLKTAFQNDHTALNADMDLDGNGPMIQASAVVGYQGWLAGYQTAFDSQNKKVTKNNFALGFSTGDFILHTNVDLSDDGQEFGGSIYQRVSPRLETGIQLAWSSGSNNTKFGIGAKYDLDRDAAIRAKVNNASQIGLGYQQRLRDGITLTLSALIDGKNFNSGGHKIGLALDLEA